MLRSSQLKWKANLDCFTTPGAFEIVLSLNLFLLKVAYQCYIISRYLLALARVVGNLSQKENEIGHHLYVIITKARRLKERVEIMQVQN